MTELIPIREAARRLGVSDTAVRKAITAGRVTVAGKNPDNARPLLAWPATRDQWTANSDSSKRSHVGGTGQSKERAKYDKAPAEVKLATSGEGGSALKSGDEIDDSALDADGEKPSYAESRAIREQYNAKLAKLEHDERTGKLVDADEVKVEWFKHITAAKTRVMGIPAACKSRYADLPLAAIAVIEQVCREAMEDLANGSN